MATVFLSYKHESQEHEKRVRDFADALGDAGRAQGVTVVLDQYFNEANVAGPAVGWEIWSENEAHEADFILVVASEQYHAGYQLQHPTGTAPGIIPEILIIRKRVQGESYLPNTVRPLALLDTDIPFVPIPLSHLQRFGAGDTARVIGWVTGGATAVGAAWLTAPPSLDHWLVADCDDIRAAFAKLLIPTAVKRILLIKGDGGLGKSTLTDELAASPGRVTGGPLAARLDIKSGQEIDSLLGAFARKLRLTTVHAGTVGRAPLDRLGAIFNALEQRAEPSVLIFDTFEQGGPYADWVTRDVLPVAASAPWLRVVVAGREVPDTARAAAADWRDTAERYVLEKLDWTDWRMLAKRLRPELSEGDVEQLHKIVVGNHHLMFAALRAGAAA